MKKMLHNRIELGFSFVLLTLCFNFILCVNQRTFTNTFNLSLPVLNANRPRFQANINNWNPPPKRYLALRFMTMNTFHAAVVVQNGMRKTADHILNVNPDIVALQEINQAETDTLVRLLGSEWTQCSIAQTYWLDVSIVTKKRVSQTFSVADGFSNLGCQIILQDNPQAVVNVWNVHLNWRDFGPYRACIQPIANDVKDLASKEYFGYPGILSRVDSIVRLLNHPPMLSNRFNTQNEPLILAGDFNVPSTLDWTDEAKGRHCNWVCDWPVSRILMDNGFVDSYRKVYPNPQTQPGNTWSPVTLYYDTNQVYLEPQDRIDYIYYKSSKMNAVMSRTYTGTQPLYYIPNNYRNDWPSDHAAVITDFDITL